MQRSLSRLRALGATLLFSSILTTAFAQGRVLVVDDDGGPGSDFTSLVAAVNSAADGDTVLIREGVYNELFLILGGRSLSLVAEEGAAVQVPEIIVTNVGPDQTVVVRGLTSSQSGPFLPALDLRDNEGTVWIEGVDTTPGNGFGGGVEIRDCANVVLVDVHSGFPTANPPSLDSLDIDNSVVSIFDSEIEGLPGSPAIAANESRIYLQGTRVVGGPCAGAAQGFPGIFATNSEVLLKDCDVSGGVCTQGRNGVAVQSEGSTGALLEGDASTLLLSGPETVGTTVQVTFEGRPGAAAFLVLSESSGPGPLLPFGAFVLSAPFDTLLLGTVPGSGRLELQFDLPAGLPLGNYYGQVLARGATTATLSAPSVFTLVP